MEPHELTLASRATRLDEDLAVLELVAADPQRLEYAWDWEQWIDDAEAVVARRAGAEAAAAFRAGCEKRDLDAVGGLLREIHAAMEAENTRREEAELAPLPQEERGFFEQHDPYLYARQRRALALRARTDFAAVRAEYRTRVVRGLVRRPDRRTRVTRRVVRGRAHAAHGPPREDADADSDHVALARSGR